MGDDGTPASEVSVSDGGVDDFEIAEYCGRLTCTKTIVQSAGRGRRREFCSETCRRAADREYKRAKALVEHFERYLRKTRHEVAAYGRRAESDGALLSPDEEAARLRIATAAAERARAIVEFSPDQDDRYLDELRLLVDAVSPMLAPVATQVSA